MWLRCTRNFFPGKASKEKDSCRAIRSIPKERSIQEYKKQRENCMFWCYGSRAKAASLFAMSYLSGNMPATAPNLSPFGTEINSFETIGET